jgi:hypothetical protein
LTAITFVIIVMAGARPAAAETDLVVLGPAPVGKVNDAHLVHAKAALAKAAIAPAVERTIDAACVGSPGCLVTAGSELGARRLLAVSLTDTGGDGVTISLAYVDVVGKELVAMRDVPLTDKRLAIELAPAIRKFLTEAPTERAKVLFAEGNQHFDLGELDQALELYKRAYRIKPLPAFLFNIAQCHRKLGHHQDAITMYQSYLVGVPAATNRAMVESLIAESKAALAAAQARDQEKAALAAKLEAERLATERTRAEETRKAKEAEALAAVERRKAEQARFARDKELYDRHPARKWAIIGGAVGAAALVTGGVFGVMARGAQSSFDAASCGDRNTNLTAAGIAACQSDRDRGQRDASIGSAFLIGGGAVVLGAALVFALDPGNVERRDPPRTALAVSPSSIQLVMTW